MDLKTQALLTSVIAFTACEFLRRKLVSWEKKEINTAYSKTSSSDSTCGPDDKQRQVWRVIPHAGSLANLKLVSDVLKAPESNHDRKYTLQIKVKTCGLNFADMFAVMGLYSATPG